MNYRRNERVRIKNKVQDKNGRNIEAGSTARVKQVIENPVNVIMVECESGQIGYIVPAHLEKA